MLSIIMVEEELIHLLQSATRGCVRGFGFNVEKFSCHLCTSYDIFTVMLTVCGEATILYTVY